MKKKMLALAVAVLCVCVLTSCKKTKEAGGNEVNPNPATDFKYEMMQDGEGIRITEYIGENPILAFPDTIEDLPVLEIEMEIDFYGDSVTYLSIPETVKSVFIAAYLPNLRTLILPKHDYKGAVFIGGCKFITELVIPKGRTTACESIFESESLTKVVFPSTLKKCYSQCTDNPNLTEIIIPGNIKELEFLYDGLFNQFVGNNFSLKTQKRLRQLGYKGYYYYY